MTSFLVIDEPGQDWQRMAFERAYCRNTGQFERVCRRLDMGFSVLVYLPGNCMAAAAQYVAERPGGVVQNWRSFLEHPGPGGRFADVLTTAGDVVGRLREWLMKKDEGLPGAIFHNLDLLCDRGGLHHTDEAKMALFSILEGARKGVVLGLSDREAGRLPPELERAFPERAWIGEIEFDHFQQIIPKVLSNRLHGIGEGAAWLIASRLRWSDPIRAVNIMLKAAASQEDLPGVLNDIWEATRPVEFVSVPAPKEKLTGFPESVVQKLQNHVVRPFERWKKFQGEKQEAMSVLGKLPPGVIFYGPPGTGKTTLAKWLAGTMQLPLQVAPVIKDVEWGGAERTVHQIFAQARRAAPCVLLFDEADDVFTDRKVTAGSSVGGSERGIVTAALQELEGFEGRPAGVLVVMTTNRFLFLDEAIRSKLQLHVRIPYPLTVDHVGQIVDTVAAEYRLELSPEVRSLLVEIFHGTVLQNDNRPNLRDPLTREGIEYNLFSPREIQQAMRFLDHGDAEGVVKVSREDVEGLKQHYEELTRTQGVSPSSAS